MFAPYSYAAVYPYGLVTGSLMVAVLLISVALFAKYLSARKSILICLGIFAALESSMSLASAFKEGFIIGFITLTCAGIMAVFHSTRAYRNRVFAGLFFGVVGCLELIPIITTAEVFFRYMVYVEFWAVSLSLALITLAGGLIILILAIKKHFTVNA